MKTHQIRLIILFGASLLCSASALFGEWTQVNNGLGSTSVTSMFAYGEMIVVGTDGAGIFKTSDNGATWIDISGDIGNKNINRIYSGGGSSVILAGTDDGAFLTLDHSNYDDYSATGLTSKVVTYYGPGATNSENRDYAIGTNGGGIFVGDKVTGPWTEANTGITGDGLIINALGGYSEESVDYIVLGTDGGAYFSTDSMTNWTAKNSGLTGDALKIKALNGVGKMIFIATRNGLFYSMDFGDNWQSLVADEKFNAITIMPGEGVNDVYVFGENGYHSDDLIAYNQIDMTGISGGEVTAVAVNSTNIFVGTESGGIFSNSLPLSGGDSEPVAEFGADTTSGLVPLTVQFFDSSKIVETSLSNKLSGSTESFSAEITKWYWDFDNNGVVDDSTQNPAFTYETAGNYTVSLTVSDGTNSSKETKTDFISVSNLVANFGADTTSGKAPLAVQFADSSIAENTTIISWKWDFDDDGVVDDTTQNPLFTFDEPGVYSVTLIVSDSSNSVDTTKTDFITVADDTVKLYPKFGANPTTGHAPLVVQFSDSSTAENTTIISWKWDFDDDGVIDDSTQNPIYTYYVSGTYTVSLTVADSSVSEKTSITDFIIVQPETASVKANFSADPVSGTAPLTVQFSDSSKAKNTTITSWKWDFDYDGTVDDTTQNPLHVYTNPGLYTVSLQVSDTSKSNLKVLIDYIEVTAQSGDLIADFVADTTFGAAPFTVQFTDSSKSKNSTISSWKWDFDGDGVVDDNTQNPTHIYLQPGKYTVSLTVSDENETVSEIKTDFISVGAVGSNIKAAFSATPVGGFIPLTVQFYDSSIASGTSIKSWAWDFDCDGNVDTTAQNPSFTYQNAGIYTVKLTVSDSLISSASIALDLVKVIELVYPPEIKVTTSYEFPQKEENSKFATTDYRLFGVPGNSGKLLSEVLNGAHKEKWQAYYDNGEATDYLVEFKDDSLFKLTTGKAFWLIHNGPIDFDFNVDACELDTTSKTVEVPLHAGWNMITNPFATNVLWRDIQSANGITNPIFGYIESFAAADTMKPFEGYYYYNANTLTDLSFPFYASLGKSNIKLFGSQPTFSMKINLFNGKTSSGEIVVGLKKGSEIGLDKFDHRKPRALDGTLDVEFQRPDWDSNYSSFYSDLRPETGSAEEWKFLVVNAKGKRVTLNFEEIANSNYSESMIISLVDWSRDQWMPLTKQKSYTFNGTNDRMDFSLFVGETEKIMSLMSTIVPKDYSLSQNYPNPFNNETVFRFSSPKQSKIKLVIYNALGQQVRTLYFGEVAAGHHTFHWDGTNDNGNSLGSGVYILSVKTGSNEQFSRKIILLK